MPITTMDAIKLEVITTFERVTSEAGGGKNRLLYVNYNRVC